jgi:hypothetical protein
MAEQLNADEQAMMDKARNTTSEVIGQGGTDDAPPPSIATPATNQMEGVDVWGPYPAEQYAKGQVTANTPTGTFGVPPGKQLYFEEREWFSRKENRMKKSLFPMYRVMEKV